MASITMVHLVKKLIAPKNTNKDIARREYILNILLVGAVSLSFVAFIDNLVNHINGTASESALPTLVVFFFFILFSTLLYLSRKGKIKFTTIILIGLFYLPALYSSFTWGAILPVSIMLFALVIVMTGILVNAFAGFIITFISAGYLLIITYLQVNEYYVPTIYWQMQDADIGDTLVIIFSLLVISIIAWIYNREMEQALYRARQSEKELRKERDNLENIVEERTKALRIAQMEKLSQLERFAELGRISSGLIHDLAAPLNLVSLNIEKMSKMDTGAKHEHFEGSSILLKRASIGTKRLESFVHAARRQIQYQEVKELFSIRKEIMKIIQILSYTAKEKKVHISLQMSKEIRTFGNVIKFNQLISNLLINAIDSYEDISKLRNKRDVIIQVEKKKSNIAISIQDFGAGINKKNIGLIFQPFFTTKKINKGMGLGLSLCKEIVEKNYNGTIVVESNQEKGTTFNILIPVTTKTKKI